MTEAALLTCIFLSFKNVNALIHEGIGKMQTENYMTRIVNGTKSCFNLMDEMIDSD
jgi:hypothetical protein